MSRTLVIGGVRSGTSRYAEQLLHERAEVLYVAPGYPADTSDPDWAARVERHQARRPRGWKTLETLDLADAIRAATTPVLIDCLGLWLTRFVDGIGGWDAPQETSIAVAWAVRDLAEAWENAPTEVVAVSNEVGWGVVPSTTAGGLFRDELGRLNATLSSRSDRVALVVAGRVLDLSDAPLVGE